MGEFRVSDKEPTKKNTTNTGSSVLGLGVKVQSSLEAFPNKMTMMMMLQHHHHHHRPFSSSSSSSSSLFDSSINDGPTMSYMSLTSGASSAPLGYGGGAAPAAAAAAVLRPLQPFDISSAYTPVTSSVLKSPGGMATSLGFPFTGAQWKELQRQAMIYKYMMASLPVPPHLLITPTTATSLDGGGFNLRLSSSSSSTDPEAGRCRRTDGKKWRCSRDVVPNHKYCDRHLHRGRPRSRKPVELLHPNNHQIKRPRQHSNPLQPHVTVAIPNNPTTTKDGSSSHFLPSTTSHPYFQSSLSLDSNFGIKSENFASVSSNKQPRGLEWMLNGDPISLGAASDSGWQSLMHNKVEMNTGGSCNNTEHDQYLNSLALYSSGLDQQDRHLPMLFNPPLVQMESFQSEKPRGFIDAWSNSETEAGESNNNKNSAASIGKLSLSSLDLSMGGGGAVHEEMGLGLMEPDGNTQNNAASKMCLSNWLNPSTSTPGGPLAEVLRPSTVTAATSDETSNQSSPVMTRVESSGPLGTMASSSPSGVLHKTFASLSDSSGNSSPTVASSRANSEFSLLKFN